MLGRLWPAADAPEPWQGIVRQLYGHLPGKPLLWSAADGGRWLTSAQVVLPDAACLAEEDEQAAAAGGGSGSGSSDEHLGPLGQALLLLGTPLVCMPAGVLTMLQKHLVRACCACSRTCAVIACIRARMPATANTHLPPPCCLQPEMPHLCTPAAARKAVSAHPRLISGLDRQHQLARLLAYVIADVDLSGGASACQPLLGLRLLPTADGGLAELQQQHQGHQQQQHAVFVVTSELEELLVGQHSELAWRCAVSRAPCRLQLRAMRSCQHLRMHD